nr:DUF2971 domain-containing protein [Treponema sp.]
MSSITENLMKNQSKKSNAKSFFNKEIPNKLYHYTNGTAFLSIVKNKQMWASHIRFMNDLKEEILAIELLSKYIEKNSNLTTYNIPAVIDNAKKFFTAENTEKEVFILSFSECKDDLNQWRGYANVPPSYSIGFDVTKMTTEEEIETDASEIKEFINTPWASDERKEKLFIAPCFYDSVEHESLIDEIINDSIKHLKSADIDNVKKEVALGKEIAKRLIFYSPLIKHEMSAKEKEWRIIIVYEKSVKSASIDKKALEEKYNNTNDPYEKAEIGNELDDYEFNEGRLKEDEKLLDFRMGKSFIVPFFKFSLKEEFFREFFIGACPDKESVMESTLYFLSKNGFSFETAKKMTKYTSNPYRNW